MARSKPEIAATCTGVQTVACFLLMASFFIVVPLTFFYQDSATTDMALTASFFLCLAGFRGLCPNKRLCLFETVERIIRLWKE